LIRSKSGSLLRGAAAVRDAPFHFTRFGRVLIMVSRVGGNRGPTSTGSTASQPPAVKAATKTKILKAFDKLSKAGTVQYGNTPPAGVRFVRVALKADNHPDGYSYTALIPVGALKPGVKALDPNKAKDFVIERSGGFAGITQYAGPFPISGKGQAADPFFSRFLDNSNRGGGRTGGNFVTEKYPSDSEDGGGGRVGGGGGNVSTAKYPSDAEDGGGGGGRVGGGGGNVMTEKYPSDAEDGGGGGRVGGGGRTGGTVSTAKYPSDNEDGGSGSGGGRVGGGGSIGTEKFPSDNEDGGGGGRVGGGGRTGGGGSIGTEKFPSDNEDGGGRTGGGGRSGGGGNIMTEKFPSDSDE
jgi:hypothetical protein